MPNIYIYLHEFAHFLYLFYEMVIQYKIRHLNVLLLQNDIKKTSVKRTLAISNQLDLHTEVLSIIFYYLATSTFFHIPKIKPEITAPIATANKNSKA